MITFILNTVWIIGLITGLLTFYFQFFKRKKTLSYIWNLDNLGSVNRYHNNLKLSYKWRESENVIIHRIAFFNNWISSIEKAEFAEIVVDNKKARWLLVQFPKDCIILDNEFIFKTSELNNVTTRKIGNNFFLIECDFLNRWDGFVIRVIVDSIDESRIIKWWIIEGEIINYNLQFMRKSYMRYFTASSIVGLFSVPVVFLTFWGSLIWLLDYFHLKNNYYQFSAWSILLVSLFISFIVIKKYSSTYNKLLDKLFSKIYIARSFYYILVRNSHKFDFDDFLLIGNQTIQDS